MKRVLEVTAHRPWPLPSGPWTMAQQWCDLLFAHWPIPAAAMRAFVPPALKLDTYDGQAWIGVVPFHMRNVRPRALPAVPWLSHFAELNVRTYVTAADGSRPGVWFFSLDAANPVAVMLARRFFMLPYFNAAMDVRTVGDAVYYTSRRTHAGAAPAHFMARYRPTGPVYHAAQGTLEQWLTERYALYTIDPATGATINTITLSESHYYAALTAIPAPGVFAVVVVCGSTVATRRRRSTGR